MLAVSSLIDFLMSLLRDEEAQAEFEADPQGVLARHGFDGLCGQDVRDVAPMVADHEAVKAKDDAGDGDASDDDTVRHHEPDDDPVREISHIQQNYEVDKSVEVNTHNEYDFTYVDNSINVDDRDTTTIVAENGDVTIEDSFNEDNDVTVIEDSFNEDNDGVDNKNGEIDDSVVAGDDVDESFNDETDVEIDDSGNTDNSETTVDSSETDVEIGDDDHDDETADETADADTAAA